ncbi:MAG: alanine racemase [Acidimicrobiales bacterium]
MPVEGVRRPAWAEISTSALAHNVAELQRVLGPSELCAVVKANGYGHGAPLAAGALVGAGARSLAVAIVDEGIELRNAGFAEPVLLLAEIPAATVGDALNARLTLTVGSLEGSRAAVRAAESAGGRHRVHVKVDTGMHRMGVAPDAVDEVVDALLASDAIDLEGLYTHFSVADGDEDVDRDFTRAQLTRFDDVVARLGARGVVPRVLHVANSAGALAYPESRRSMSRVGLALYGYLPGAWTGDAAGGVGLRPALTLRAKVVASRLVDAGERPSYGRRRALSHSSWVATVPFGYADGYPRRLFDADAEVLIRGRRYPLAGSVTMDQLLVDCGDDEVRPGDEVVLLGRQGDEEVTAEEWARRAGTISWEILCGIGARVPRVVVD